MVSSLGPGPLPDDDPPGAFGRHDPWCRPFVLLAAGRPDQARTAVAGIPPAPADLLHEARCCLHALLAVAVDDRPAMARLYAELRPAATEIAGAGSGLLTLRPVAHYLGDLAAALGRPDPAREHYQQAIRVAERAGARHWVEAASAAMHSVDSPACGNCRRFD